MKKTVGIVGARGHAGAELIRLLAAHPQLELAFVSSRELAGQPVSAHIAGFTGELRYENLEPRQVADKGADAVILALPNGKAGEIVAALDDAGAGNGRSSIFQPIIASTTAGITACRN